MSFDETLMMRAAPPHESAVAESGGWDMVVATPET